MPFAHLPFLFFLPRMWVQCTEERQPSGNHEKECHTLRTDGGRQWEPDALVTSVSHKAYPQSAYLSTTHHVKGKKHNLFKLH